MIAKLLPEAEAEIQAAAQWYEDQLAGLGSQFLSELIDALQAIEQHPGRFARYTRLRIAREIRRRSLARFPYLVVYEVRPDEIRVLAVAHAHRRPNYWRKRL